MKVRNLNLIFLVVLGLAAPWCARAFDESIFTTNTLFIEAEDADFGHGQTVTTGSIGMTGPYVGGSYTNLGDINDLNFDWNVLNSDVGNAATDGTFYRINTLLSAGKHNGTAGNNRGTFTVSQWWTLGWNSEGDWENYTRTFPATATPYFVFGHLASGGRSIGVEIDQVTAGFGQDDTAQVKKPLGFITPGRATAGWDSLELFPMTDTNGAVITISLTGQNTIRAFCMTNHDEDMDYFAFVPATAALFSAKAATRDQIDAFIQDAPTVQVDTTTLAFTLNGTAITGTATKANGLTTVVFPVSPLLVVGATNTMAVTFKDTGGATHTASSTFVETSTFTHSTLFIEAEDADYSHGQFVTTTNIGMNGIYPGNSYTNLGTPDDLDFDWHVGVTSPRDGGSNYRVNTGLTAGKHNGSAGNDRGYFQVLDWWTLGWNSGGDWANYTRNFPPSNQWYEVYGHLASGGSAIVLRMDQITSGAGQEDTNQVKKTIGYFSPGRATAGWDSLEIFPLVTAESGGKKTVVQFNGKTTFRITQIGNEDCDYYAFVPVTLPAATITINTPPQSIQIPQGTTATLTVAATTTSQYGISYQWKLNGTAIAGANNPSFTTPVLQIADSGGQYTVVVSSPGAPDVTSAAAVVTVVKDTTPPAVVSAGALVTYSNVTEVGVIFNKPLGGAGVTTPGNYTLDNGATVSAARWMTNSSGFTTFTADGTPIPDREQGVVLTLGGALNPATSYNLTVKNVADFLGNTLTSQTLPVIQAPSFKWVSLGFGATNTAYPDGIPNNAFLVATNGFNLENGGNAFWTVEDDITMVYEKITGDFDKTTQVEWNDPSSNWARAGISARESVNPADSVVDNSSGSNIDTNAPRYQMVISDPMTKFDGTAANDAYETNRRLNTGDATSSSNGGGNPVYPQSFVRLKRVGSMISMFYSTNGNTWWRPLGTTDFSDPTVSTNGPLNADMFVGPTVGVENANILGQGGTEDQEGPFTARFRNYATMGNKARGSGVTATVGLNFGANEAGAQLSTNDVAGVDVIAQAHWNNIFGNTPTAVTGIVEEKGATAVATTMTVTSTGSGNTWASQGPRGEEGASLMTGNDAVLMTGYLDTGSPTTTLVMLTNVPPDLTGPGYDVVVYGQGGVGARGGAYRITDAAGNTLRDYVKFQDPLAPTGFIQIIPDPNNYAIGNFLVFTNLTASTITIEATTDFGFAFGGTPRAPINAVQLVTPAGLLAPGPGKPTLTISSSGGVTTIIFTGTLQSSTTVNGTYAPVAGATSPYTVPTGAAATTFFRAHQ